MTKQDTVCLVYHSGRWNDETGRVRAKAGVTVRRGDQDEGGGAKPGTLELTFDNRDGWALPTNPVSPFYATRGAYTPIVYAVRPRLTTGAGADVVDTFTGRTVAGSWGTAEQPAQPYSSFTLGSGGTSAVASGAGTHAIAAAASAKGDLQLPTSALDGVFRITGITAPQATGGELEVAGAMYRGQSAAVYGMVRIHLTTGNAVQVRAYRASTGVQIGSTYDTGITHTGTGQALNLEVAVIGRRIAVKVWTTVEPDAYQVEFTDPSPILAGWVGIRTGRGSGNTNAGTTASYSAWEFTPWDVLFSGEINTWDPVATGNFEVSNWYAGTVGATGDASTRITAAGILHRLNAGRDPLRTVAYRRLSKKLLRGYWTMEDPAGSTALASSVESGSTMQIVSGHPRFSGDELAPWLGSTMAGDGNLITMDGYMEYPTSTSLGFWNAGWLFSGMDTTSQLGVQFIGNNWSGSATNRNDFTLQLNGSAGAAGRMQLYRLLVTASSTSSSTLFDYDAPQLFDGTFHLIELLIQDDGADVAVYVLIDSVVFASTTLIGTEYTTPKRAFLAASGPFTMGHLFVDDTVGQDLQLSSALHGYPAETPGARVLRLCTEEAVAVEVLGDSTDAMGPQYPDTLVNLLGECAATNDGVIFEPASWTGVTMRTRYGIYNQSPAATIPYAGGNVSRILPVIDTRGRGNDVTITNRGGLSWQQETAAAATGRVKVDGVDTNYLTTGGLEQLQRRAEWELAKASLPGARYPALTVDIGAAPALAVTVGRADVARQIAITGLEPDTVYQVVRGVTHRIGSHTRTLTLQGTDATVWRPGVADDASVRYDSGSSTTTGSPAAAATSFFVTTTVAGDLWTTDPAHFPLSVIVGGEVITVAAIVGASSPQEFQGLTRSVNGISKQHAAGTPVRAFRPGLYAL